MIPSLALVAVSCGNRDYYMMQISNILEELVRKDKTPSIQYILFDRDKIFESYRKGFADIKNRKQVTTQTTYNAFSVTKTFTAIAILQLHEQGRLNLADTLGKFIDTPPWAITVTIRQLLTHTAGIPNPVPLSWIHPAGDHGQFDRREFFREVFAKTRGLKSEPGTKFMYSNLGYVLLGEVIEQVSGMTYEEYVTENILRKAGIGKHEMGFAIPDPVQHAHGYQERWTFMNLLLGFFIDKKKFMDEPEGAWKPFKTYYVNGPAYGGLVGTPEAFMKYLRELIRPDGKLISVASRKLLFAENNTTDGKPTGMCMSWYTGMLDGKRYVSHAGGGGGYYCEIRIYPEAGIGSVVFFNRTGVSDERFLDHPDRIFFKERNNR
jgi:CubicO group peptidase (beta-lactamase class C family)